MQKHFTDLGVALAAFGSLFGQLLKIVPPLLAAVASGLACWYYVLQIKKIKGDK